MKTITYSQFLDILSALDEHTNCQYTRKELSSIIFKHYISKGPFFIYNSWNTKAYYTLECQERDFVKFINLIKQ